ncbi:FAD-dependent oxidoreductase [Lysinibacillus sp. OL1_EC]|uniref:NAD(P)-binding protein n=1 Tax=unclassified Lysinibacillus TaxID=2636778 RepID=UPI001038958D|nr:MULTISPECIES: NAD(P)-binding protein [unclassified Lysinibacillus]MCM0626383.1 FAD-dependent oxidoreductase [Lysinibacillus sp. OL1_EC]TBV85750.1 FAD-dependent oxidoreductase [Lysinibacillus sp. OL1]
MSSNEVLVVGGGIVGIFSAIYLKKYYNRVVLVERETELGGLLKSKADKNRINFDYGTHIPCETLISEIDEILFNNMSQDEWEYLDKLSVGNYFLDSYYAESGYPNTLRLLEEEYLKGIIDLLNGESTSYEEENLEKYLKKVYGKGYTNSIYRPLMKKLTGKELDQLHTKAYKIFDISRLIVGDYNLTRELKMSSKIDSKIAFPQYSENYSKNIKFYPKNNKGIGIWIKDMAEYASKIGIEIFTDCKVTNIKTQNSKISELELSNQEILNPNKIIWTVTPYELIKLLDIKVETYKPEFKKLVLCNIIFNKNFNVENHYLYCFDSKMKSYRITLYPNLTKTLSEIEIYNCTVEAFLDKDETIDEEGIIEELCKMGVIDPSFTVISFEKEEIMNGFPIITEQYVKEMKNQQKAINDNIVDVILLGKAKGESFFMVDTLTEAYEELSKLEK